MQEDDTNNIRRLGTRHRAAIGITEETDAIVLVVSEENGKISIANKGRIVRGFSADELASQLKMLLILVWSGDEMKDESVCKVKRVLLRTTSTVKNIRILNKIINF